MHSKLIGILIAIVVGLSAHRTVAADCYFRPLMHGNCTGTNWDNSSGIYLNTPGDRVGGGYTLKSLSEGAPGPHNIYFAEGTYDLSQGFDGAYYQALGIYSNAGGTVATPTQVSGGWYESAPGVWLRDPTNHPTIINCASNARAFSCFVDNVVIDGLQFTNAQSVNYPHEIPNIEYGDGIAGIMLIGTNITIKSCRLAYNYAGGTSGRKIVVGQDPHQGAVTPDRSPARDVVVENTVIEDWDHGSDDASGIFSTISNLTVRNCTITGARTNLTVNNKVWNLLMEDTVIDGGVWGDWYGVIYGEYDYSPTTLNRCQIRHVTVDSAVKNQGVIVIRLTNCLITDNSSRGVYGCYGDTKLVNCTVVNNPNGDVVSGVTNVVLLNCVVSNATDKGYGGHTIGTYSMTSPVLSGEGNIGWNPKWVAGTYRLAAGSPCINAGTNESWMAAAVDLDGWARLDRCSGIVDMGAYENIPGITLFRLQ